MSAAYQSFAHNAAGGGVACVVTKPSGTVAGDLLLAFITNVTPGSPFTPASGFALVSGAATTDAIYSKVADGSEPASYSWTPPTLGTLKVVMVRVNSQAVSSPVVASSILAYASRVSHVLPTVTATADNLLLQVCGGTTGGITWTAPGGTTERFDAADIAGCVAAGGDQIVGAGATGTRTWTPSASAAAAGFMVAVAPIPPAAGTFTGGYVFAGSGFAGAASEGQGTFTGGYDFDGTGFVGAGDDASLINVYGTAGGRQRFGGRK